ncbi:MAG: pitrilysin family protein [Myxococcota bacterium]|nr:pitrilysin family protein [Myxococcota bacterium]
MRASLLGLVALAASLPSTALAQRPIRYTLDNGLSVALDPIPGRATVSVVVSVDAGLRDQPEGWSGLAHLTEHLMFDGTPAAPGHVLTSLERLGATAFNGMTTQDATVYVEVVPASALEQTLWLEAERFAHGLDGTTEADVEAQRRVLERERAQREFGREEVWDLVGHALYPSGHPYARGREQADDVAAIRLRDVRWFFERHYGPDMLTLAISGGFDPEDARRWIERYFSPLRRGPTARPPEWVVPPLVRLDGERRILADAPRSTDLLYVAWPTPPLGERSDAALDLAARHLQARLRQRLLGSGEAVEVDVWLESHALASRFSVWIAVPSRQGTLAPLRALDAELARMHEGGVSEASFQRALRALRDHHARILDSPIYRGWLQATRWPRLPGGYDAPSTRWARYEAVSREDVGRAAERYLPRTDRLVVSIAGRRHAPPRGRIVRELVVHPESR